MWQSDADFLKDLDQMDEICTSVIVNDQTRSAFQDKQTGTVSRNKRDKRTRLYSFSDEEEETPIKNYSLENLDPNDHHTLAEVGNQIRKATGNVYNNDVITEYWQKSSGNQASKAEPQEISDRGQSLVFEPKYNFQQPLASANSSPRKAKPKNGKRESVAMALANNLQTLKAKSMNKIESEMKPESVPKVEELAQPKVEAQKVESRGRCRISLPIASNNYKNFYSGAKITPPNLNKEYVPENPIPITNTWETWEDYSEHNFDQASNSSHSSYTNTSDTSSSSLKKNFIDVNSKTEFPPL